MKSLRHTFPLLLALTAFVGGCSAVTDTGPEGLPPAPDGASPADGGSIGPGVDAGPGSDSGSTSPLPIGDPSDCAGTQCRDTEACLSGRCVCRPGLTRVDGSCVDLTSDPNNCGAPGNRCGGDAVCAGGGCHSGCPDPAARCDGACVSLAWDPLHCGECGRACDRDQVCIDGGCRAYAPGVGCTACPCDACGGDVGQCCGLGGAGAVICVDAERCPERL